MDTPKSWVLEKVTPALNIAILGKYASWGVFAFLLQLINSIIDHYPRLDIYKQGISPMLCPETGLESPNLTPTPKT